MQCFGKPIMAGEATVLSGTKISSVICAKSSPSTSLSLSIPRFSKLSKPGGGWLFFSCQTFKSFSLKIL